MEPREKLAPKTRAEQIAAVAFTLKHSPARIRHWISAGCDLDDPDSIVDFYLDNARRRRNRGPR